jgi:hypothetical protein
MDDTMELGYAAYDAMEEAIHKKQWDKVYLPTKDEWGRSWLVQRLLYACPFHEEVMEALLRITEEYSEERNTEAGTEAGTKENTDWHMYFIALYPPLSALRYFVETGRLSVNRADDGILLGRYLLLPDREAEVQYLLEKGACPNLQHADTGNTILMDYATFQLKEEASSEPFDEIVKRVQAFIEMGVDPLLPNKYGLTVVDRIQLLLPSPEKDRLLALLAASAST